MSWHEIIKVLFERASYFSAIVLLVAVGVLLAPSVQISIPQAASEWSGLATLVAVSVLLVNGTTWSVQAIANRIAQRVADLRSAKFELEEVQKMLSPLTASEAQFLQEHLAGDHPTRFDMADPYRPFDMGKVTRKQAFLARVVAQQWRDPNRPPPLESPRQTLLFEVHPLIWKHRKAVAGEISRLAQQPASQGTPVVKLG